MNFSISNIAWEEKDDKAVYQFLSKTSFRGLEIAPTRLWASPYEKRLLAKSWAKKIYSEYNLIVSSIQSIWYGRQERICDSNIARNDLLNYTKQAILFAEAIGCKNLVFGCPKNRNINTKEDYKIVADFLDEIGTFAYNHNTVFSIEPNPSINTTMQAVELCRKLNNKGVRINYDFGTAIANEEKINDCLDNLDVINHIHISEPYLEKINSRTEHKFLLTALVSAQYNGFVSIEMKKQNSIRDVFEVVDYIRKSYYESI